MRGFSYGSAVANLSFGFGADYNWPLLRHICKGTEEREWFLGRFELYTAYLLVGVSVDIALVGLLAANVRFRKPSASTGLLGRFNMMVVSLRSRWNSISVVFLLVASPWEWIEAESLLILYCVVLMTISWSKKLKEMV